MGFKASAFMLGKKEEVFEMVDHMSFFEFLLDLLNLLVAIIAKFFRLSGDVANAAVEDIGDVTASSATLTVALVAVVMLTLYFKFRSHKPVLSLYDG